ncbi:tripartite tricarboxylate transporter TctB family protein [Hydrogenophaga sp. BPS33]|uniref:tripartite tricarboxylate transporter TctB family protein n=1 Tax=Hydrogenophaga sp. BPS33 TaxID=2651974 RepID=UPI00131FAFD2|nr:tripartite tricarboxylate transporter TctB family protein [Hydrogenophaga sp. BPS33]QHE84957.1 hypothetical protein F9K07_08695 [Hydrogenophaga sp. BPS33]
MIKNLQDFLAGLLFVALGLGFGWAASRHELGASADMGPGYVPLLLGLLLCVLGLLVLFKALTFEALGSGRVRHWGVGPLLRVLGGLLWLALCSGPAQWPWVGSWFAGWPTLGVALGVSGLVFVVVSGAPGGSSGRVWWWAFGLAALVCAVWVGPLALDVPLWPRRAGL